MKTKEFEIAINGRVYPVVAVFKYQRNIYYRFRDDKFYVTAPYLTLQSTITSGLLKFAPRLLKRVELKEDNYNIEKNEIYILGELKNLDSVDFINEADLKKKIKKYSLEFITGRVRYYEQIMGINKPYKVHVKSMSTRYGSNSVRTHSLSFKTELIHYSEEIIDSVVIHELAHYFYRGHQRNFYNFVLKYCPDYWALKKKLNKRIHK